MLQIFQIFADKAWFQLIALLMCFYSSYSKTILGTLAVFSLIMNFIFKNVFMQCTSPKHNYHLSSDFIIVHLLFSFSASV